MVVSICSVPDMSSPKRRWSEGTPSTSLPCCDGRSPKRCREDSTADTSEPLQAVVMLEDNGGIWHVGGLLEMLAGALCATLGADPASLAMACAATDGLTDGSAADPGPRDELQQQEEHKDENQRRSTGSGGQHRHVAPALAAWPALTEGLLRAHTATAGEQLQLSSAPSCLGAGEDDDRSSVASLSAWVGGSSFRRGSDAGVQASHSGSPRAANTAVGFSFAPAASATGAAVGFSFRSFGRSSTLYRCGAAGVAEARWPLKRAIAGCCWR